jgi:hypothetical protein
MISSDLRCLKASPAARNRSVARRTMGAGVNGQEVNDLDFSRKNFALAPLPPFALAPLPARSGEDRSIRERTMMGELLSARRPAPYLVADELLDYHAATSPWLSVLYPLYPHP